MIGNYQVVKIDFMLAIRYEKCYRQLYCYATIASIVVRIVPIDNFVFS